MSQVTLQLEPLTCPSCMQKIKDTVTALKGIEKMRILFHSSKARIVFDEQVITETTIRHTIEAIGYTAQKI